MLCHQPWIQYTRRERNQIRLCRRYPTAVQLRVVRSTRHQTPEKKNAVDNTYCIFSGAFTVIPLSHCWWSTPRWTWAPSHSRRLAWRVCHNRMWFANTSRSGTRSDRAVWPAVWTASCHSPIPCLPGWSPFGIECRSCRRVRPHRRWRRKSRPPCPGTGTAARWRTGAGRAAAKPCRSRRPTYDATIRSSRRCRLVRRMLGDQRHGPYYTTGDVAGAG